MPVVDLTRGLINTSLIYLDDPHNYYIIDSRTGAEPLKGFDWLNRDRVLDLAEMERGVFTDLVGVEPALMGENIYLALQAMGLGGWLFSAPRAAALLGGLASASRQGGRSGSTASSSRWCAPYVTARRQACRCSTRRSGERRRLRGRRTAVCHRAFRSTTRSRARASVRWKRPRRCTGTATETTAHFPADDSRRCAGGLAAGPPPGDRVLRPLRRECLGGSLPSSRERARTPHGKHGVNRHGGSGQRRPTHRSADSPGLTSHARHGSGTRVRLQGRTINGATHGLDGRLP